MAGPLPASGAPACPATTAAPGETRTCSSVTPTCPPSPESWAPASSPPTPLRPGPRSWPPSWRARGSGSGDVYNFAEEDFFTWPLHPLIARESTSLLPRSGRRPGRVGPQGARCGARGLAPTPSWTAKTPRTRPSAPPTLAEAILSGGLRLEESPAARVLDAACHSGSPDRRRGPSPEGSQAGHGAGRVRHPDPAHLRRGGRGRAPGAGRGRAAGIPARPGRLGAPAPSAGAGPRVPGRPPGPSQGIGRQSNHGTPRAGVPGGRRVPAARQRRRRPGATWTGSSTAWASTSTAPRSAPRGRARRRLSTPVMGPLYAYLTSPKRTGLRTLPGLDPRDAQVMCETARQIITQGLRGEGVLWSYLVKNAAAPVHLARRKFDLVLGRTPPGPRRGPFPGPGGRPVPAGGGEGGRRPWTLGPYGHRRPPIGPGARPDQGRRPHPRPAPLAAGGGRGVSRPATHTPTTRRSGHLPEVLV